MTKQRGFTLLEVVIALSIMASVLMVLTSSWRGNYRRVKKAKVQTQVAYLMQKKMSEIEVFYADKISRLPKDKQNGVFKEDERFSWEWTSQEFKMPDLGQIFLKDEGVADQTTLTVINKMKDYLEKSIHEVKLTVIYKASPKAKTQKFSVSTILVDYQTQIDVGLGAAGAGGS